MSFMENMKREYLNDYNVSITENGAVGYHTSGKDLLDLNFSVSSLRFADENEIWDKFLMAFYEDHVLAMKWLFFARDVRGGLGERRLFRTVMKYLADKDPNAVLKILPLVSEYGRYDDLLCLLDNERFTEPVCRIFLDQLCQDHMNAKKNGEISLLAKWLPSENASSPDTKRYARIVRKHLGLSSKQYRKILSFLRGYLNVVETKMSAKQWGEINYEAVPSRANLIYKAAFLRNDELRRREYLEKLKSGDAKINASVLYPYEIVYKYRSEHDLYRSKHLQEDIALEAMWRSLPDKVNGCGNTIVVADGSGSMLWSGLSDSGATALDVANALAIYFAERSSGEFKDKYITFSSRPQLVDFSGAKTLCDKIHIALKYNECANTNIEAVFDLILSTAVNNHMSQSDLPANILIISDMEFDECAMSNYGRANKSLFKVIGEKYEAAGYKMPRLVFWNTCSRTGTIPVIENDMGVALVSGFSVNVCDMVMSGELDPYKCLLATLNSARYQPVEDVLVKGGYVHD